MSKSAAEWLDNWIFCGYRILLYKWERAIAFATSDDRTLLDRVEERLRTEMAREISRRASDKGQSLSTLELDAIVLQTNGEKYAGPLIADRFQILGSWVGNSYYVVDHQRADLLVRVAGPASDTLRFVTIDEAKNFIKVYTNSEGSDIEGSSSITLVEQKVNTMAKAAAKAQTAREKAAEQVAATKAAKVAAKAPAKVTMTKVTTAKAPAKVAPAKTSAKVAPAKTETTVRGSGVGALTQTLILQGLDNESIITRLQKDFPEKANSASNVNWYRNKLRKEGAIPASPRGKK